MLLQMFARQPSTLWLARSLITMPTGKCDKLNRKSIKSFPASANTTLWAFVSTRSFKLICLLVASVVKEDATETETVFLEWYNPARP
ncbi:hypothetical protein SLA2020_373800 [Shorea laevis]